MTNLRYHRRPEPTPSEQGPWLPPPPSKTLHGKGLYWLWYTAALGPFAIYGGIKSGSGNRGAIFTDIPSLMMVLAVTGGTLLLATVITLVATRRAPVSAAELQPLSRWLYARYGIDFDMRHLRRLARMRAVDPQGHLVSARVRVRDSANDGNGRPYITYVLTNYMGGWILYSPEYEREATLRQEKDDTRFLLTMFADLRNNGERLYTYIDADDQPLITANDTGAPTVLFWTTAQAAADYTKQPAEAAVYAEFTTWLHEVLPLLARQDKHVGLNYGSNDVRDFPAARLHAMLTV